ncbi:hypothetical protein ACNVEB_001399 [Streptococcus equinus]|uniref:hypothetical protein n=1 Tax=Streptococcus equinus TaxID=1335 RepID=UPI003BF8EC51
MVKIKIAIAGVGNCASNFVQGIEYYKKDLNNSIGLVHRRLGKYDITDIEFVAAFDISKTKVGEDLSDAIFKYPNNTKIVSPVPKLNVIVEKGPVLDVWNEKFAVFFEISDSPASNVEGILRKTKADILVILLPTGSDKACEYYVEAMNSYIEWSIKALEAIEAIDITALEKFVY